MDDHTLHSTSEPLSPASQSIKQRTPLRPQRAGDVFWQRSPEHRQAASRSSPVSSQSPPWASLWLRSWPAPAVGEASSKPQVPPSPLPSARLCNVLMLRVASTQPSENSAHTPGHESQETDPDGSRLTIPQPVQHMHTHARTAVRRRGETWPRTRSLEKSVLSTCRDSRPSPGAGSTGVNTTDQNGSPWATGTLAGRRHDKSPAG